MANICWWWISCRRSTEVIDWIIFSVIYCRYNRLYHVSFVKRLKWFVTYDLTATLSIFDSIFMSYYNKIKSIIGEREFDKIHAFSFLLMMSESDLLKSRKKMRHCIVMRKLGLSTCFELYEESTHEFLMSCVTSVSISPMLLFVKLKDCHLRRFEDICCNLNLRHFVARMLPDWLTGLTYKLTGFEGKTICEIK